jgi:hypothetical protein
VWALDLVDNGSISKQRLSLRDLLENDARLSKKLRDIEKGLADA